MFVTGKFELSGHLFRRPSRIFATKMGGHVHKSATRLVFGTGKFELSGHLVESERFH